MKKLGFLFIMLIGFICGCCTSKSASDIKIDPLKSELQSVKSDTLRISDSTVLYSSARYKKAKMKTVHSIDIGEMQHESHQSLPPPIPLSPIHNKPQLLILKHDTIPTATPEMIMGRLNYLIKDTMEVGKDYIVEITISKGVEKNIVVTSTPTFSTHNSSEIADANIRITPEMQARLIDPSGGCFDIKAISDTVQLVENDQITIWRWRVKPLKDGKNTLSLVVDIIIGNIHKSMTVYDGKIYVYIQYKFWVIIGNFITKYWQWIAGSLILPAFAWWFNFYIVPIIKKNRKKRAH